MSIEKKFSLVSLALCIIALVWTVDSIFIEGKYHYLLLAPFIGYLTSNIETNYYHKFLAHRQWKCPRWLEYVFLTFTTGFHMLPGMFWAGGHRKHHFNTDNGIQDIQGPPVSLLDNLRIIGGGVHVEPKWMENMFPDKALVIQAVHYWKLMAAFAIVWSLLFGIDSWFAILIFHKIQNLVYNRLILHGPDNEARDYPKLASILGNEWMHKSHHDKPSKLDLGGFDLWYHGINKWYK